MQVLKKSVLVIMEFNIDVFHKSTFKVFIEKIKNIRKPISKCSFSRSNDEIHLIPQGFEIE